MFEPLTLDVLAERIGTDLRSVVHLPVHIKQVVSPRDFYGQAKSFIAMPRPFMESLIRSVWLAGDPTCKPYANCEIQTCLSDPHRVKPVQRFVMEDKILGILIRFNSGYLGGLCMYGNGGLAKCSAGFMLGTLEGGQEAIAIYLPPLVEVHDGEHLQIDGTHRGFICRALGVTHESITIESVTTAFPVIPQDWTNVSPYRVKPKREVRYEGLNEQLFREIGRVGIDA